MQIKHYITGVYDVNTYLLYDEETKEAVVIDYGGEFDELTDFIDSNNLKLKYILNTHGHFDHISGENTLQQEYGAPVYIHKKDEMTMNSLPIVLAGFGFPPKKPPKINCYVNEDLDLALGNEKIKVIETPGHTKGCVCYLVGDNLFSGDTLFYENVGRTDLPGGSFEELKSSIKNKLYTLPDNTKVFPGHGNFTSIGHEKLHNEFVT